MESKAKARSTATLGHFRSHSRNGQPYNRGRFRAFKAPSAFIYQCRDVYDHKASRERRPVKITIATHSLILAFALFHAVRQTLDQYLTNPVSDGLRLRLPSLNFRILNDHRIAVETSPLRSLRSMSEIAFHEKAGRSQVSEQHATKAISDKLSDSIVPPQS